MLITRFLLFIFLTPLSLFSYSQTRDSIPGAPQPFQGKYYTELHKKIGVISERLTRKSLRYLAKFQKQERTIRARMGKIDSIAAHNLFSDSQEQYRNLARKIEKGINDSAAELSGEYLPYLDSLKGSLFFLQNTSSLLLSGGFDNPKISSALNELNQLQDKLQYADAINQFIKQRKQQITEVLSRYSSLPNGIKSVLRGYSKKAWYYTDQIKQYKNLLNDPGKIEIRALRILNQLPAFQVFMKEHSGLQGLFNLPVGYESAEALAGLQTRDQIQQLVNNQMSGAPNATQIFGQQVQAAQQQLNQFKDKLNKLGSGSGDIEMPDFKPNGQKTRSFGQRLEYGFNVQFGRNNSLVPSAGDIAFSAGYKLNDKSAIGIGLSYKLGLGTFRHIQFTNQGIGLRSFLEYKIKKQIFISGGYEMNYNAVFKNIEQLKKYNAWQKSGLIGISKKYKISKKIKGNAQLLYDFLAHAHIPYSQPILFRIGYNF